MDDFDGNAEKMDGYLSLFHSQPPQYRIFHAWSDEMDFIKEHITTLQSHGFNLSEIVIGCRLKESLRAVKSFLHKIQMHYYDLPDESGDAKGIHLCTFNSLKGLEYKAVFLCDVHAQTAPLAVSNYAEMDEEEKAAFLQSERSLLYVAMTRAMYNLIITGTGKKSDLVDL
jgi:superfamily I DNA/RNA helicase